MTSADRAASGKTTKAKQERRGYVRQADVPGCSVDQALRIPQAIADEYALKPATPLEVARALDMLPNSGPFRNLCGAAAAYGLTVGTAHAGRIALTPLGKRIVRPLADGEDIDARRKAFLTPRVIGEFIRKYGGAAVPRPDIAMNVLEDMGVPAKRTKAVLELILSGARSLGFVQLIKEREYIQIPEMGESQPATAADARVLTELPDDEAAVTTETHLGGRGEAEPEERGQAAALRRVFVTHGKNKAFVDPIKKLLGFGELEAVVSVERQSVSKPVPDKVMDDMRSCGSAIIHVEAEETLTDHEGKERKIINPNVLIEIGAAMALYGRRFILLVREGVDLPSNLQGLFEVRYTGETLDGDATIRVLEATTDIKSNPLPERYGRSGETE